MIGALHLYQGEKLVHFEARLVLGLVAQRVGHDGLGVGQVFAERNSNWLACCRGHCELPLEGHKQPRLSSKGDSNVKEVHDCARISAWRTFPNGNASTFTCWKSPIEANGQTFETIIFRFAFIYEKGSRSFCLFSWQVQVRLTYSQDSVVKASQRRPAGHWKPNRCSIASQPVLAFSQSVLQGGLGFPDTHSGV